jgi:undecaprenyl-diphosphatase
MSRLRNAIDRGRARSREWSARIDIVVLVLALAAAACGWAFLVVADAATPGPPGHVDERLLRMLRQPGNAAVPIGPPWLAEAARDMTALGGPAVLTLLVAAVVGHLLMVRHAPAAVLVLAATIGGAVLSDQLKGVYARPRPDVVPHLAPVTSASFPSGHAMLAAVVYLTLGALLARLVEGRWAKRYFVSVAIVLALIVGASRVFLGVHYPSDVLAGWAAGLAWASLCWLGARQFQRRGLVEGGGD